MSKLNLSGICALCATPVAMGGVVGGVALISRATPEPEPVPPKPVTKTPFRIMTNDDNFKTFVKVLRDEDSTEENPTINQCKIEFVDWQSQYSAESYDLAIATMLQTNESASEGSKVDIFTRDGDAAKTYIVSEYVLPWQTISLSNHFPHTEMFGKNIVDELKGVAWKIEPSVLLLNEDHFWQNGLDVAAFYKYFCNGQVKDIDGKFLAIFKAQGLTPFVRSDTFYNTLAHSSSKSWVDPKNNVVQVDQIVYDSLNSIIEYRQKGYPYAGEVVMTYDDYANLLQNNSSAIDILTINEMYNLLSYKGANPSNYNLWNGFITTSKLRTPFMNDSYIMIPNGASNLDESATLAGRLFDTNYLISSTFNPKVTELVNKGIFINNIAYLQYLIESKKFAIPFMCDKFDPQLFIETLIKESKECMTSPWFTDFHLLQSDLSYTLFDCLKSQNYDIDNAKKAFEARASAMGFMAVEWPE